MNELTTEFPYELNKDMKFIEEIDHGAFGKVIHVKEIKKNLDMAVKIINKAGAGMQLIKKMKEEISILKKLNHNNIVKFYGFTETNSQLLINMEYVKYGTLSRWMKNHHKISENDASALIGRVLSAVEYLHSMHICHRDIKPENIMISKENDLTSIKIIDFGLSAQHFHFLLNNDYCGTFIYMAPEQIEKKLYFNSVDIWSIGILMYMLLNNGKHPFYQKNDCKEDIIKKIKLAKLNFINKISYMAKNLMHKLCEPNPSWRYSASLAIKHPWITRNPNDEIPLTFNEILIRNNNKKNGHALIMINIFLNYAKKNNIFNSNNKGNNNNSTTREIKKKNKNKIYIINEEYINNCEIISNIEKEIYQKKKERYFEVLSTDEEDSFEKKKNDNNINNLFSLKKANKPSEKSVSPPKRHYIDDPDDDFSIILHRNNSKKNLNNKKNNNLNNKYCLIQNDEVSNFGEKNNSSNIYLSSVPNKIQKDKNQKNARNISSKVRNNINKQNIENTRHIYSNKNLYKNINLLMSKNVINSSKAKSKSISKFFINKNEQDQKIDGNNEVLLIQERKEKASIKSRRSSVFRSSKFSRYQNKSNLPYVLTLVSQAKNNSSKKANNNSINNNYNIIPLVLPFIGNKKDDEKNK